MTHILGRQKGHMVPYLADHPASIRAKKHPCKKNETHQLKDNVHSNKCEKKIRLQILIFKYVHSSL